ncbi:hypothetical protein [Rathayibacter oskolensis]|nr:hypothetical protein [Rathayibacter oskolensis]
MMKKLTVAELIDMLSDLPGDAEVRLASQPSYPMEYEAGEPVAVTTDEGSVVYLPEARHVGYLPGAASAELGWR